MRVKVIGCGISGIVSAILLQKKGHDVTIFEKRSHIGGNCFDSNIAGTLVHNYGPHLFHTNDDEVFNFLSAYTEWFDYMNRPKGNTELGMISLPYSKKTILEIGRTLSPEEIVNLIFRGYSEKQWGVPFEELPSTIINRVPKVANSENPTWYEGEKYQCLPKRGYTEMMNSMLDRLNVVHNSGNKDWEKYNTDLTVFTGKIDEYFNYTYGHLPYRTLDFVHHVTSKKLPHAIINQNKIQVQHTREYDHSFFNYLHTGPTVITKEYSRAADIADIPFYPMPFGEGLKMYSKYKELADKETNTLFIGRLATYTYLDMWMAVKQAMLKIKRVM